MFRRSYLTLLYSTVFIVFGAVAAYSQSMPVSGVVELDTNGTRTPVAGALIEVFRVDIKTGFPSGKTDKRGAFSFAGIPLGGTFAFSVSAPGCSPNVFPDIKAGQEKLLFTLKPGDGRKLTETEVRDLLNKTAPSGNTTREMTADEKKQKEEYDRQVKEINEKNANIQKNDAIAAKANTEGRAALDAKNYDDAIAKFSEGIQAVPDFIGSTPVLLLGKMIAQKGKGFEIYRSGVAISDPNARRDKFTEANKYYDDALVSFNQALAVIKGAPAPADATEQKKRDGLKLELYSNAAEVHRIKAVGNVDTSKAADAANVYAEYIAMEQDPARKAQAQLNLGDIMRLTGDFDKAAAAYREVLTTRPDQPEAMAGLGLSLFAAGAAASPEDKAKEQEGLNFMQKYTEIAPVSPTDSEPVKALKTSVKEAVDYLKSQKMAPQKVTTTAPKKKP